MSHEIQGWNRNARQLVQAGRQEQAVASRGVLPGDGTEDLFRDELGRIAAKGVDEDKW